MVARVTARVTAGMAESNGSLPPGLWLTPPAGWLPRTGISSGTLHSVIEYGQPLYGSYWAQCNIFRRVVGTDDLWLARSYLATPTVHLHSSLLSPVDRTASSRPVRRSISDQLPAVSASVTVPCPSVCLSRQAKASKRAAGSAAQHQAGRVLCRDPRYKEQQRIVWAAAPEHITSMRLFIYNFISPSYMVAQH